jgi:hypothetical protein
MRDQWRAAATELSDQHGHNGGQREQENGADADATVSVLLETALDLVPGSASPAQIASDFAELLAHLVDLPGLRALRPVRVVIECLCANLPPEQSPPFWPILVKLRAEESVSPPQAYSNKDIQAPT